MAGRMPGIALAVALVAMLCARASAQPNCATTIVSLAPCLSYIVGNSSTPPPSSCCTQLSSVVKSQPQCLCMVINGGAAQLGIPINQTRALALPGACNVQAPPTSQCSAVSGGPAAPPAGPPKAAPAAPAAPAPTATPSEPSNPTPDAPSTPSSSSPATPTPTPATNVVPSGNGSKTTGGQASGGSLTTMAIFPISMLLFLASYAMNLGSF